MRERVMAGILTVVMVVSSLQIQTVSVLAMEQQQTEENGSFMEENAETVTATQGEEAVAEEAESEVRACEEEFGVEEKETEPETKKEESGVEEKEAESGTTKDESAVEEKELESGVKEEESAAEEKETESGTQEEDAEDTEAEAEMQEEGADAGEEETADDAEETAQESVGKVVRAGIASGTYKENGSDVSWAIDENGKLTVEGRGEFADSGRSRQNPKTPWYSYRASILSAEIKVTDMTDASFMFYECRNLTSVDLDGFDTSKVTNMQRMFLFCSLLTDLDLKNFRTGNVTDMSWMFYGCYKLTNLDVSSFNTVNVTDMSNMFYSCNSLTSLNVNNFDTGNVTNMSNMFYSCNSLTSLNVDNFNTSNVTNMSGMFNSCDGLKSLNVSNFNTCNVTDMSGMFGARGLTNLNLSSFDTSKVTNMSGMFGACWSLMNLDLSSFDTSKVTNMHGMFLGCNSLTSLNVKSFDTGKVTNMSSMFAGCSKLTGLDLSNFDTGNVTDMNCMFDACNSLTSLDLGSFDTGNVTDMLNMFWRCSSLTSLNVSSFDTGKVTNMAAMFCECSGLTSLDVSGFDTGNVTNMSSMFGNCSNLRSLDLSSFDTRKVRWMCYMFDGCSNLTSLNSSSFDTSQVISMDRMFDGCSNLTSLDVSGFGTGKVISMANMFSGCSSLTSLDVSGFDTSSVGTYKDVDILGHMYGMFSDCSSLTSLDLSSFDVGKVDDMDYIFNNCKSLELLYTPRNVQVEALLPQGEDSDVWYDYEGNSVAELPKNLSYSIVLTKNNKTPALIIAATKTKTLYEIGETLNADDVKVRCCDDRGIVVNVTEGFTTNAAEIDMSTPGKKILKITYNNMTTQIEIEVVEAYPVTFAGTGKDDIAEGTPVRAKKGADYIFTLVKAAGYTYAVTAVMGGQTITPVVGKTGSTYTIPNVTAELVITVEKTADPTPEPEPEAKTYTVTFTGTGKDDIAEGTAKEVKEGTDYTFTLVKAAGYTYTVTAAMGENSVTPTADGTGNTYTVSNVTANLVITIEKTAGPPTQPESEPEDTTGLQIKFVNENDKKSIYTGMAIQPEIKVTYNGKRLTAGVDYTVKYSNNIKVGTAKITITGKGNFSQANSQTAFDIAAKNISDRDVVLCGATADGTENLAFKNASKFTPVLYYNNIKLTGKDYVVKDANGSEITNKKLSAGDNGAIVKIEGKSGGNFTGSREVTLKVVDKSELVKFTVAVDKTKAGSLTYNGSAQYIHNISGALTVTAKNASKTQMQYGTDYTIVYPNDVTSAGIKKFTVVGMGLYTGSVSKSYTIKSAKETALKVFYDGTDVTGSRIREPFQFASAGITFNSRLAVKGSGDNLIEGKDYKVSYSGNKKVNQNAKCTISFLGNYKGHAKVTVSFEIAKADLGKSDVVIADQLYKSKAGIYKSVPYVIEDKNGANSLLSASNYKVTYYIQDPTNNADALQMKGKNKAGDGDIVWIKLEAKGKNYSGEKIVSYKVRQAQDLSKAKITFQDAGGAVVKSTAYTGSKITASQIKAVVNGTLAENDSDIEVIYVNNINKGKATVIVKAAGGDGCKYTGCKKATFSIVARNLN